MVVVRDVDVALTDQEAAVYDRQIRVWGVETQRCLLYTSDAADE